MARKTKQEAERTYHRLLDAAAQLFIKQGVSNTTLNDIATRAGMSRGAVYWHFDNKDKVIMALWERNAEAVHRETLENLDLGETLKPASMFRETINQLLQKVADEPPLAQVMSIVMNNVELTEEKTELQFFLQNKKGLLRSSLTEAFKTLQQRSSLNSKLAPALLTQGLLAYIHGLVQAYLEPGGQNLDLKKDGSTLLDLYLDTVLL